MTPQFEKWAREHGFFLDVIAGMYSDLSTRIAWEAWQASEERLMTIDPSQIASLYERFNRGARSQEPPTVGELAEICRQLFRLLESSQAQASVPVAKPRAWLLERDDWRHPGICFNEVDAYGYYQKAANCTVTPLYAAPVQAGGVADGWQLVPIEPTELTKQEQSPLMDVLLKDERLAQLRKRLSLHDLDVLCKVLTERLKP